MRLKCLALILIGISLGLNGCKKSADAGANQRQIAVIAKSTGNSYWEAVHAGAQQAADEEKVHIIWTGPESEDKHTQQANIVDNMVNRGVAGIVIAPTNYDALVRPVESAVAKGVPVVLIDSTLHSTKPICVVATDNYAAGRQAADALAAAIGDKKPFGGKVLMLRYLEGSGSTEAREKGFTDRIKELGFTIADAKYVKGTGSVTDAGDTADALLLGVTNDQHVAQVDGIFASNQPMAIGMMKKIAQKKQSGVTITAPFVGFDACPDLLAGIRSGEVAAVVTQDPRQMGYQGVKAMVAHLNGKPVEPTIATKTATVTKANIDKPEIKAITLEP
jgi:ribose transport system substrate-binding protein